jgi:hypothetical protein
MRKTLIAFLVAPLLPALAPAWFLHANYPNRAAISGFILICGVFYLLQAVIGIPAYILTRSKRRYIWFHLLVGFFGMAAVSVAINVVFSKTEIWFADTLFQAAYVGALGAGIGLVFWLVARPDKIADPGLKLQAEPVPELRKVTRHDAVLENEK